MDCQMFPQDVDRSIGVESSDLDKILQYLAREDPPPWQRSSTLIQSDEAAFFSPRIDPFVSPWLPSPHVEELQPYCFADSHEILPEDNPQVPLTAISSSLLALQRELFGPFTSDFSTSSITEEIPEQGISIHGTKTPSSYPLIKSSFQQQLLQSSDDLKQKMNHLPHPDLSRLASPHLPDFSGHAYSSPPDLENSGRFCNPNFEFLFGGDEGSSVVNTPNSSSSSSLREEAMILEEFSAHPVANSPDEHRSAVSGSKTKVADQKTNAADESFVKKNKSARKGRKRVREARYAIQTKSDKDVLEDGYKWRKYGQKAVKNSPHPRSYYRCTFNKCSVKKTVERSCTDSGLVITTYEGVHVHPSPAAIRNSHDSLFLHSIAPFSRQYFSPQICTNTPTSGISFESTTQLRGAHHMAQLDKGLLEDMLSSAQVHDRWLSSKAPSELNFEV